MSASTKRPAGRARLMRTIYDALDAADSDVIGAPSHEAIVSDVLQRLTRAGLTAEADDVRDCLYVVLR